MNCENGISNLAFSPSVCKVLRYVHMKHVSSPVHVVF